ncbi:MAG: exodeoxyribonuclease III [Devosiaceae bacterium]|nr:exodeoxyribonuclease III [Devosiaceae bacterium MH13]
MSAPRFRLATWNINSVRLRIDQVVRFLGEHEPDVLCLQETKCREEEFPAKAIRAAGYEHMAIHGQKAYHGSAIVSRLPLEEIEKIDFCAMGDARHVAATVALPQRVGGASSVRVHSLYVPAGGDEPDVQKNPKFDHKLKFVSEMADKLRPQDTAPTLVAGDLNIAPYEHDVWSHKQLLKVVSHTPMETELFERTREALGYADTMRRHQPLGEKLYTWWSYRARDWAASNKGRRLDHVWTCPLWAENSEGFSVFTDARGWEKASDHAPVIVDYA